MKFLARELLALVAATLCVAHAHRLGAASLRGPARIATAGSYKVESGQGVLKADKPAEDRAANTTSVSGKVLSLGAKEVRGQATIEATFKTMVLKMLSGEGPTVSEIEQAARGKMGLDDAVRRLEGRLPADVAALLRVVDTQKGNQVRQEPYDPFNPPQYPPDKKIERTEDSMQKARGILNGMMEKSWMTLDNTIIECKEFQDRNRGAFAQVTADLARLGSEIADLERKKVGASQGMAVQDRQRAAVVTSLETLIKDHESGEATDKAEMATLTSDLGVFDFVLALTRCSDGKGSALAQLQGGNASSPMSICDTPDGPEMQFTNKAVQKKFESLLTPGARQALREAIVEAQVGQPAFWQVGKDGEQWRKPVLPDMVLNATTSPLPTTSAEPVHEEPVHNGQWKKCIDGKPNCGLLHDTMSIQWGKFKDNVDSLQAQIEKNADLFKASKANLNNQLAVITDAKTANQEMLAEVVGAINTDSEEEGQKSEQHRELSRSYKKKMADYTARIEEILFTDICAVRKVRNEVLRSSKTSPPSKIMDCDVQDFVAGACDKECDDTCAKTDKSLCGGLQTLTRQVIVPPSEYGLKCPALERNKKCNQFKCQVDCVMSHWSGWSKCTKECGSGVQGRTRSILTKPNNGGEECDSVQDTRNCNTDSCDRDCKLKAWTAWTPCSTACGGGIQERFRKVLVPIRGKGKCPGPKHPDRLAERRCNIQMCEGDEVCIATQDLIIALDGSGSLKEDGFEIVKEFAANLTGRYLDMYAGEEAMRVGVVLFGNGEVQSAGTIAPAINVQGLTADMAAVKKEILGLKWQKGLTNMAQAFVMADTMFQQGGRPAAQSALLVISDGKYSFKFQTGQKARQLKDKNVHVFMAPISDFRDKELKAIQQWASQPWETNYERIPGLAALKHNKDKFAKRLIAKFCPDSMSPSAHGKNEQASGYMLIHEGGLPDDKCSSSDVSVGVSATAEGCAAAARARGLRLFAWGKMGISFRSCHVFTTKVTKRSFARWTRNRRSPNCPGGAWVTNPYFDVYAVDPQLVPDAKSK